MHLRLAVLFAAVLMIVTGCSAGGAPRLSGTIVPGFNRAVDHVVSPGGPDGGVLRLVSTRGCGDWLPEQAISPWCVNLQRFVTRQLMTYGPDAGRLGAVVVPDLASSRGRPNEDRTTWSYELQRGLRWEDGEPITMAEVARGIRALDLGRRDVTVVEVSIESASSLSVTLREPLTDFDALLALPVSAPRREAQRLIASGPYRIASTGLTTVFERNPQWEAATDGARRPKVDRVEFTVVSSDAALAEELSSGRADLAVQGRMESSLAQMVLADPSFAAMSDNPGTGRTAMLAVPANASAPLREVDCRRAVYSAVDRLGIVNALAGGVTPVELAAKPATSLSPATIPSFDSSYQPFSIGDGTGDIGAARSSLVRCGYASGFPVRFAFARTSTNDVIAASISRALSRVGIRVEMVPLAPVDYAVLTASPAAMKAARIDLALLVQSPRVSGTWGFWNPLVSGALVGPGPSTNVAQVRIPSVDILLRSPEITSTSPGIQENVGRMIDRLVLDTGSYIPLATVQTLLQRPADLTNVTTNGALGNEYDLVQIGKRTAPSPRHFVQNPAEMTR
jgi:peptide/nickel transport system substrate-binding protein